MLYRLMDRSSSFCLSRCLQLRTLWLIGCAAALTGASLAASPSAAVAQAQSTLFVAYPPDRHETTASQIFLIGSAPPTGEVQVNGQVIQRSDRGYFAPSFPLQPGENVFTLRYGDQTLTLHVTRKPDAPSAPVGTAFAKDSLVPSGDIARLPNEPICFSAIAPANASVSVRLANQTIPLLPQPTADLPPNSAVLTLQNQPIAPATATATQYQGCGSASQPGDLGIPEFRLSLNGQTVRQSGMGHVTILSLAQPQVVEVTADPGAARSGPSTDYSRLTPLPKGTRAAVTGREGEWLRLDYGAWILASDTQPIPNAVAPRTLIRSISARPAEGWTEVRFPLQTAVPLSLQQGDRSFTLTLYNTTAQTDIILLDDDPVIRRLDWQQVAPGQVQYTFNLKSDQQWGYRLRYEGTTLVLSLRHPPHLASGSQPLAGLSIVLDPGHGGPEDLGSVGPNGTPEKQMTLALAKLLRDRLMALGAKVYLTREADVDLDLRPRIDFINRVQPTLALSLHYNALPDNGDAQHTSGVGAFWYNPQAHDLAMFLHHYLTRQLRRSSYGVFWDNLALTRPTVAPTVLLELGFMTNPQEFEWISNPQEQARLANTIAEGITEWMQQHR